jgi:hypothetical protein
MTLDLARIAGRLDAMAEQFAEQSDGRGFAALESAYANLRDDDLRGRLRSAKTSWLLARTDANYRAKFPHAAIEGDFAVVASDGSFILPDRHGPGRFYLINIGKVMLRYGTEPDAELLTDPHLYYEEHELFVPNDLRRIPVSGAMLGLKRAMEELRAVAGQAERQTSRCRVLALQDGTLILWGLQSQPDSVVDWVLEPFLTAMRRLRDSHIPVTAFISYPGSNDVMNTLRVSVCDYPAQGMAVNCDHCRARIAREGHMPACDILPEVTDRELFETVARLRPGERSQVFASTSRILDRYGPDFHICFFYLHTGTEIARVEVPRWVAADSDLLDFTHAAVFDQCDRGGGYPSALQEAHELAVIREDERRAVEIMVEESLARRGIIPHRSAKDGSKRGRFI